MENLVYDNLVFDEAQYGRGLHFLVNIVKNLHHVKQLDIGALILKKQEINPPIYAQQQLESIKE